MAKGGDVGAAIANESYRAQWIAPSIVTFCNKRAERHYTLECNIQVVRYGTVLEYCRGEVVCGALVCSWCVPGCLSMVCSRLPVLTPSI